MSKLEDDAPLSAEIIRDSCGDSDPSHLETLELIFTRCTSLANLHLTPTLRTLSCIDTGLMKFGNLLPVGHTLTCLTLIDQMLVRMEPLPLPQLKRLYLQNNRIEKIEHLSLLPRLEVLWLSSNRVSSLEGLENCANLRELWVAENRIPRLGSHLQSAARLESLNIAGNQIADYSDVEKLSTNARLRVVSFDDCHFGSNPVVSAEGYRTFSICYLPQIQRLDGVEVAQSDREAARAEFTKQVLEFNNRVEQVQKDFEREFTEIDERRHRSVNHAEVFRQEMVQTFEKLQQLVLEGRSAVVAEHTRQERVREENLKHLETELLSLQKAFNKEIDKRIENDARAAAEEEKLFHIAEMRARAEKEQAILMAKLQRPERDSPRVVAQLLGGHGSEFQHISRQFRAAVVAGERARPVFEGPKSQGGTMSAKAGVMRCYRIHNCSRSENKLDVAVDGGPLDTVYIVCDLETSGKILQYGLAEAKSRSFSYGHRNHPGVVMLHSDPELALSLFEQHREQMTERTKEHPDRSDQSNSGKSQVESEQAAKAEEIGTSSAALLVCRIASEDDCTTFCALAPSTQQAAFDIVSHLPNGAALAKVSFVERSDGDSSAWLDGGEEEDEAGEQNSHTGRSYAWLVRPQYFARVVPEYHVLVGRGAFAGDSRKLEAALENLSLPIAWEADGDYLLEKMEAEAHKKIKEYMERVWEETNPTTADRLREIDENMRGRADTVTALRKQIQGERLAQEELLRGLRQAEQDSQLSQGPSSSHQRGTGGVSSTLGRRI